MKYNSSEQIQKLKDILHYIGKLISTALIVILLFIGAFLIYYFISAKVVALGTGVDPKISLYTIVSGSMEPAIKVFDIIVDIRVDDPSTLKVGDVITFKSTSSISKDKTVTHRIADIKVVDGKYEFVTKGDSNHTADSSTAKEENLIGKTLFKIPKLGYIQYFLLEKIGWVLLILIPAIGIIIYDLLKVLNIVVVNDNSNKVSASVSVNEYNEINLNKQIEETIEKIKQTQIK